MRFGASSTRAGTRATHHGAIAHFAQVVDDKQLLQAKSREVTIDLRNAATAEMFGQSAGSAHGAIPTILAREVVDTVLRLDLESPSGRVRQSFWIDLKEGKLLKPSSSSKGR